MKNTLLTLFVISVFGIGATILFSSSSNGRAFATNSGNTGAPGEGTTCRSCHGSGFNTTVSIVLRDGRGTPVTSYVPGTIYTVDFNVNSTGGSRYGFQLTSLSSGNTPVNTFTNPSANTRLVTLGNGRSYAEHAGKSVTSSFSTNWTGPASGTGAVTFYGGGAAVNNNGGTSGDGGNVNTLIIQENTAVGINDVIAQEKITVYPNPATDYITINAPSEQYKNSIVSLVDKKGRVVFQQQMNLSAFKEKQIETDSFRNGMYLLKIEGRDQSFVTKVVLK